LVDDELIDRQFINFIQSETSQNSYQAWVLNKADYTIFEQGFSLQKLKENGLLINSAVT
jgi:hypothetical protein